MESKDERARQVRDLRDQLGDVQFADAGTTPATTYSTEYEKAALVSSFDAESLHVAPDSFRRLLKDCVVLVGEGLVRYALEPDVRRRVLRQLGSRTRMQETLDSLDDVPHDPLQDAITQIVADEEPPLEGASIEHLQATHQALSWFADIIPTEPPEAIRARIEAIGYRDRFERLVGENFSGREDDLIALRDYVGLPPEGRGIVGWVRELFTSYEEKPALVITGPGGIGKSTLLAKFLLDHAGERELPFIYANFDSPTVRARDPKTILMEGLRQLHIQYPEHSRTITALRRRLQGEILELADLTDRQRQERDAELTERLRREFVSLLASVGLAELPFLLVMDTFEVVQERQRGDLAVLYDFLRLLQRDHPVLRTVISGRASLDGSAGGSAVEPADGPADGPVNTIRTTTHRLRGLSRKASEEYLVGSGLTSEHATQVAGYLIPEEASAEGASPLALRVAAEVWRRDLERPDLDASFWAQLRAGRIQAQLITRYLRHTDQSSTAGRLALPALMLRRIDADALAQVVAPAWDVPVPADEAGDTFTHLAGMISLVLEGGGRWLLPRPEVQAQVVDLLSDLEPDRVARLHDLAIEHYAALSERADDSAERRTAARFDEILHRLAAGEAEDVVRARWSDDCAVHLTARIALLTPEQQTVLDQLAGRQLSQGMRATATLGVWEGDALTRARNALGAGDPTRVVGIAGERDDWSPASELSLLLAKAHLGLRQPYDALDVANAALDDEGSQQSSALVADLHLVAAEACYALTRPQDVFDHAEETLSLARDREDVGRTISAQLLEIAAGAGRDQAARARTVADLKAVLATWYGRLGAIDEERLLTVLGPCPELVPEAVRFGGLRWLTSRTTRELARRITKVDEEYSERQGKPPGLLASAAGLKVGTSVTRTWQDVLSKPAAVAQEAVLRALEEHVPSSPSLREYLADSLSSAVTHGVAEEATIVEQVRVRLNKDRREALVRALLEEVGIRLVEQVLAEEFDRTLGSLTSLDAGDAAAVTALVETAEREDWLGPLVIAARNRQPRAPQLLQVANELDLSTVHFAARSLARAAGKQDLPRVLIRLGDVEGQIGRVERNGKLIGTGLLVSPELFLVAASAVPARGGLAETAVRFGVKTDAKGETRYDDGSVFPVVGDLVGEVPYGGGPGLAIVRLGGYPADEPLGAGRGQRFHVRRGFADISHSAPMTDGQNAFVCWQQQARLELHIERRALTEDGPVFRMPSLGATAEGAPCFNRSMEFLGVVLASRTRTALVVPGAQLWRAIADHGYGPAVGAALS